MGSRILVADDEERIARMVGSYLEAAGFSVRLAFDGPSALRLFRAESPDLLVLDISMPGMDGLEVAREVRKDSTVPIVFLTARSDELDRVLGLELGADDYVTKPFSPRELVARLKAILRRTAAQPAPGSGPETVLRVGGLELDRPKRTVRVDGAERSLTSVQFDILSLLMAQPGRVFSRLDILEGAIGSSFEGYERTVDAHIKNIRKALGDDREAPRFIGTVRGVGYRFIEAGP